MSVESTSTMRQCELGGTGSAPCSRRRSENDEWLHAAAGRSDAGIWTKSLSGSMAKHIICGVRRIRKGEVLESFVTKTRDRRAAVRFLKKAMKRHGQPQAIVTDRLGSYRAAMRELGNAARQETGCWINNRAENSHQPFRRRERAMARFRSLKSLQKFASIHASIHNHFNKDRHLERREIFKNYRSAALAEWRQLAA